MDNLSIFRIWNDSNPNDDMCEISIHGVNEYVSMIINCYTNDCALALFASKLIEFPKSRNDSVLLEFSVRNKKSISFCSIEFSLNDNRGHVNIKIIMDTNASKIMNNYTGEFIISSEIGLVNKFGKSLQYLAKNKQTETSAILHDYE